MPASRDDAIAARRIRIDGFEVQVAEGVDWVDPAAAARLAIDPANALETIHWGRNYLYSVRLESSTGPIEAAVKLFRNQGLRRRLERRFKGSKAERSWHVARAMRRCGLPTPEPLLWIESEASDGASLFVTRRLVGFVEARYLLRALRAGTLESEFPQIGARELAESLGTTARRMHDAGFWHRDFSIGNLLVRSTSAGLEIEIVDLNRARRVDTVTLRQRSRDLSRLGFDDAGPLDEAYLVAYWGRPIDALRREWATWRRYRSLYLWRVEGKKKVRTFLRGFGEKLFLRKPYAHIPPPPAEADARDKSVWDKLSDQPHQHASRSERLRVRLMDSPSHLRAAAAAMGALTRSRRHYRRLRDGLWRDPVAWPGVGVGIGPSNMPTEAVLKALDELGVDQVLLRFHPWEEDHDDQLDLAAGLARRGVDLTFALPQIRSLVTDPGRWRRALAEIGAAALPYGRRFQVGQAINRSKWGLWNYREYVQLMSAAQEELRALGEVEILGPGVIDFEPHALASALGYPGSPPVDITSGLLYVDRRGAPENEQLGFDALAKVAVMRAIAESTPAGAPRYWITEFNWPLWEGPHSPAGRKVSVDELRQADYMVRYCVPILSSGLAERAYWWQLAARGYGLADPRGGDLRRRPVFRALATLQKRLAGSRAHGPVGLGEETRGYRFSTPDGNEVIVAWSLEGERPARFPIVPRRVLSRDGDVVEFSGDEIVLTPSPCYLHT